MSLEIANFLKAQAAGNEELRLVLEKLDKEIIRYNQLQAEDLALQNEELNLQMMNRMLQSIADHIEVNREQDKTEEQAISELYDTFQRLPLRKLDMNDVLRNHIELEETKWQNEKKELDEEHRQRIEMCERLENRNIVKKLRQTQKEYQGALKTKQEAEAFKENQLKEIRQKLNGAEKKRNDLILRLVIGAKTLETARREKKCGFQQSEQFNKLEDKRNELRAKLQQKKLTLSTPTTSSISRAQKRQPQKNTNLLEDLPTFDPRNPMAFLNSLNVDTDTNKILREFSLALQKRLLQKEVSEEKSTELRPILRNKTDANDDIEPTNIKSKGHHVRFLESDSSSDGSSSLSTHSPLLDCEEAVSSNLTNSAIQEAPTVESATDDEEMIDMFSPVNRTTETNVDITEMFESTMDISQATAQKLESNVEMSTKSLPPVVEVLKCRTIKPAGTPLPERVPFTLSPLSEISDIQDLDTVAATRVKKFEVPQPPTGTQQLESFKLKNASANKSTLKESKTTAGGEKSLEKKNLGLSFGSLFVSNKLTSSSDSDDDLGFITITTNSNTDNFMFAFDDSYENKNEECADSDQLKFNLCDSDAGNPVTGYNTFDL